MSARAARLADDLQRINQEVMGFVRACSDAEWQRPTRAEGRTVGVTAHHIAIAYPLEVQGIQVIADGENVPVTMDEVDAFNARHRVQHAACTREDVLSLLETNGAIAAEAVRYLSDEQLSRAGVLRYLSEQPLTVEQIIEMLLIGHVRWHLEDMRGPGG